MFVSAGNPVLSVPNGDELEAAMAGLELSVAIDLYVTETSRHCDFVLPATTFYEREDFPLPFLALFSTPFIQMTEAVVEPRGEARQEWEVIEEIAERIGVVPSSSWALRLLGRIGLKLSPRRLVDLLLRDRPEGRPVRTSPRRAQPRQAGAKPARDRARRAPGARRAREAGPPSRQAGPPRPARDRAPRPIASRRGTATTRTSRCG